MSPPTLLRTPIAMISASPVSGLTRRTCDRPVGGRHTLHGGPERHIQPALLVESQVFPAMGHVRRHVVIDHLAFRHLVEVGFGILVLQDPADVDHVEGAVAIGEPGRHLESGQDGLDLLLAVLVDDGVDVADAERADEQRALVAHRHLPRAVHALRVHADLEALGQLHRLQVLFQVLHGHGQGRRCRRRQSLLRLGFVAQEPVGRRVGPELLLGGVVALERLRVHRRSGERGGACEAQGGA